MYANAGGFGGDRLYIANDIVHTGDTDTKIEFGTDIINFDTGGSERLRITSSGAVMINTTNSSSRTLNLKGTFGILSASQTGVIDMSVSDAGAAVIAPYVSGGSSLELKTNASGSGVSTRLMIASDGQATFDKGAPGSSNQVISRFQAESSRRLDIVWHDSGSLMGFDTPSSHSYIFKIGGSEKLRIVAAGIDVTGTITMDAVPGTNTNSALPVLFQTSAGVIDGGSQLTYNPGGDVLKVNGLTLSTSQIRTGGSNALQLTTANANGTVDLYVRTTHVECNGDFLPQTDNDDDLGSSSKRWANIYSADLQLSNVGTGGNEVDGTEGKWTLQEAEDTVYMINRINGKRYKIKMEEV